MRIQLWSEELDRYDYDAMLRRAFDEMYSKRANLMPFPLCISASPAPHEFSQVLEAIRGRDIGIRIVPCSGCNDEIDNLHSSVRPGTEE